MDNLKFKKQEVLTILKENRSKHRSDFDDAITGYEVEASKRLQEFVKLLKAGKRPHVHISLPLPQDMTKEYDRAIRMLEMSVGEEVELSEHEFAQYIQNDWHWMNQFLTSNSGYMATGSTYKARR